ncbi:hypothetical protein FRC01_001385 [Tulasnella sp. 417]|nr:hypothetical protein FRC01_001385 [Tulasnella sp. 417]
MGAHWVLAIIVNINVVASGDWTPGQGRALIFLLDSLSEPTAAVAINQAGQLIRRWLRDVLQVLMGRNRQENAFQIIKIPETAQQPNGSDCGLYVHHHLRTFLAVSNPERIIRHYTRVMTKKKGAIFSSNGTNPDHVTRLRDPSFPPRATIFANDNQLVPFETTDPWDLEAHRDDKSNTLIPITPLLDAARQLRYTRHGSKESYEALVAEWEGELNRIMNPHLFDAAIGQEKNHRQLDRDVRLFLAVEVAKYRKAFPGPRSSASSETKAHKDRVFDAAFDVFPDLAPQNRVFKTQEAQVAYVPQFDIYFRGRLSACAKKDTNGLVYASKRISRLEDMFIAATKRKKTALDMWLGSLDSEDSLWQEFESQEHKLIDEWVAANPDGNLNDNRLQLERAAKRKVFEEECKKNPALYDEAKAAAAESKTKSGTVTAADRAKNTFDALGFLGYAISRITDLAEISVTVIAFADCGETLPNAYVNQYGYPRGQALVDNSEGSAWSKSINPLISDFVTRISAQGQNAGVRFGELLPKVERSALETLLSDESAPEPRQIELTPYNWDGERSRKRAKAYFETNIRKIRGLNSVMWKAITKNTKPYLQGLPDILFYETGQFDRDSTTGEIKAHPIAFRNPSEWDDAELFRWEDHIAKSEAGKLPADQTLAFVDSSGQHYYSCSALGKSPNDDPKPTPATNSSSTAPTNEDAPEDFTDQMNEFQPADDSVVSDSGDATDFMTAEERRDEDQERTNGTRR